MCALVQLITSDWFQFTCYTFKPPICKHLAIFIVKSLYIVFPSCNILMIKCFHYPGVSVCQPCVCLWCVVHRYSEQEVVKEAHLIGKGPKKCWRLEGNDSVSGFFLINLHAALDICHRESEVLVKEQDTSAVPFYMPLRDAGCLLPFIPLEPQTKQFFLTNSGRWRLSGLLLAVKCLAVE